MKTPFIAAMSVLLLLLAACSPGRQESAAPAPPAPAAPAVSGTAEVREAQAARASALAAGDVEAYLNVYTDEAVWMPPGSAEIVGKEAARARMTQVIKAAALEPVFDSREQVVMSPEWIADRGHYSVMLTPKPGGEARQEVGFYLTLWSQDADGRWKIFFDIWNTNQPAVDTGTVK